MQGQPVQFDAAAAQRRFQLRREMQSRRRRRDRAFIRREHGLVVGGIAIVGRALGGDVGRQRRRAEIGDGLIQRRSVKRERQRNLALFALGLDLGVEMAEQADLAFIAEANDVAGRELLRRLDQRLPARTIQPLDQRRLDLRLGLAADAAALELGGYHLGVVDDELVARLQPLRQLGDGCGRAARRRAAPPACARHRAGSRAAARCWWQGVRSRRDRCAWPDAVIARLVRNCALGRRSQYSRTSLITKAGEYWMPRLRGA